MGLRMVLMQQQRLERLLHSPLKTPRITEAVKDNYIFDGKNLSNPEIKMRSAEIELLNKWIYSNSWKSYLDKPLFSHAYSALALKELGYDAVVGIESAGVPYAKIFGIMGFPVYSINYSHYKKKMEQPLMDENQVYHLKSAKKVLLTDIDIVSGKTLRECRDYLNSNDINVPGAYIGLSQWEGIKELGVPTIGEEIAFKRLWRTCGRFRILAHPKVYEMDILPKGFNVYNGIGWIENIPSHGQAAANDVLEYLNRK